VSHGGRPNQGIYSAQSSPIVAYLNPPLPVARRARQSLTPALTIGPGRNQLQPRLIAPGI
jgi:hypothetical protein